MHMYLFIYIYIYLNRDLYCKVEPLAPGDELLTPSQSAKLAQMQMEGEVLFRATSEFIASLGQVIYTYTYTRKHTHTHIEKASAWSVPVYSTVYNAHRSIHIVLYIHIYVHIYIHIYTHR